MDCSINQTGGLGYRAVVINFRGCSGVPITSPQFYSAGNTDDTRQALYYISNRFPQAPLLGLGFSLGANVMTRYIAEEGKYCRLSSGCVLACPWDVYQNTEGLKKGFIGTYVYSKQMGGNLLGLLKSHASALMADPDHEVTKGCEAALALENSPTIEAFDNAFTRIAGGPMPPFPFNTAQDYYRWASSHNCVKDICIPFIGINAANDPIVQYVPMHGGENPFVVMKLTNHGGHIGWFESLNDRWTTTPVLEWLKLMGDEFVGTSATLRNNIYVDLDGFIKEEGRPTLGCKPVTNVDYRAWL